MREWIIWGGAVMLLSYGASRWRHIVLSQREAHVLKKKYGDLPMFDDFFQRLKEEQRKPKGRVS